MAKKYYYTSPKGTVVGFCAINKAYENEFKLTLAFEGDELVKAQALATQIAGDDDRSDVPSVLKEDKDGNQVMVFKQAEEAGGYTFEIGFKARDGKTTLTSEEAPRIGEGSVLRVRFEARRTDFKGSDFIKNSPKTVQIISASNNFDDGFADEDADSDNAETSEQPEGFADEDDATPAKLPKKDF